MVTKEAEKKERRATSSSWKSFSWCVKDLHDSCDDCHHGCDDPGVEVWDEEGTLFPLWSSLVSVS